MALSVSGYPRNAGQLLRTQSEFRVLPRDIPALAGHAATASDAIRVSRPISGYPRYAGQTLQTQSESCVLPWAIPSTRGNFCGAIPRPVWHHSKQPSYFSLQNRHRVYMRLFPCLSVFYRLPATDRQRYLLQDRHHFYIHVGPTSANRVLWCFRLEVCQRSGANLLHR